MLDWMKRQANLDLNARVAVHADRLDLTPARIVVRDQTTRWGSCSTSGALSFSWRLVLAPPFVLDYLAAHEVAHLGHMNHGPRFWNLVERTMPRHEEARTWLRKHGASLHRYGAEGMLPSTNGPAQAVSKAYRRKECRACGGRAARSSSPPALPRRARQPVRAKASAFREATPAAFPHGHRP
jgi:hypothetical protein